MGLLLSILVFSVGVLETLACVRHIQQGILPAWAPRHVTSASGRRLLREHWRKSTSQDDGSGDVLRLSADGGLLPNGAPSRRRLSERKGSLDDDLVARPRPPPLTLGESPHHVRSPDIHWPDPVPHSPVKCIEQKLPSPVAEVPGDAPAWPSEAPPALQKRRTSKTEILPHEEQRQALPLRDATPDPSFAREAREPPRLKPAKASSFEEARIEPFAPPEPKAPGVITITHTDHSEAGPQAAVVGRIEIKAAAEGHEDDMPAPWPIINIDTVVTSDEEGDLTPPTTTRSRRVSFDPVPTVVVIDKEKAIIEERMRGTILAPSIRITDDLESVLRKELPSVIDDIIQQALVKVNEVLECRQNGSHKGVSLVLENLVARSDKVLNEHLASVCAEEYQTNFEPKIESVFYQQKGKEIIDSIVPPEEKIYNDNEENVERRLQSVSSPAAEKKGLAPTSVSQEGPPSKSLQIDSKRTESPPRVASPSFDSDSLHTLNSRLGSLAKSCLETEAQNIADLQNEVAEKSKPTESTHAKPSKSGPQAQKGHAADLTSQEVEKTRENSQKITLEIPKENENKRVKEAEEISSETTAPVVHLDIEKTMQATSRSPHGATNETIEPTLRAVKNDIRNDNRQHSPTDTQERISKLQSTTTGEPFSEAGGAVGTCAEPVHPGTAVPPSVAAAASTPAFPDAKLPPESRDETASAPTVPTEFIAPSTEAPVESAVPNIPSLVPASAGDIFVPVTPAESTILAATDSPVSLEPSVDTISLETSSVPSAFDASPIPIPVPPDLVAPVTLVLPSPSVISAAPTALVATAAKDTFNPPFASPAVPTSSVSLDTSDDSIALTTPDAVDIAAVPTPAAAAVVAALPTSAAPVVPLIPAVSDSSTPFPSSSHDVILAASPLPVSTVDPSSHTSAASAVPSAPASPVVPITPATAFTPTSTALTVPAEDLAPAISPVSFAPDPVSDSAPAPTSVPAVTSAPSTPFPAPVPTPVPSSDVASALSSVPPPAPLKSKSSPVAPSASPVPPTSKSPAPSPAPAAGAPFKVEESSSESSSSGRSAAAGRPTAPVTNPASPQPQAQAHEAFWLIFSGEYTKAMSKDWHSGHFCCWQCDESLTGQRYVLRDDHPYCIKCYESVFANMCEECNRTIGIDSKDLSYKDKHWHEACFLCTKCRVSLVDKQFGSKADKIYCGNCYDAQFASRCDGCGEIFRAGTKKMEYKTRQWHEKCFCCVVCKTAIGTKSFIPREQEIYCAGCYEEKFATRCVKCNKIITSGGVTYKNEPWHRECFTCTHCNTSLAGQRFTSRDEKPYCADCFGELFAKRCTSCSKPITGIGGTRFISFEDRHWHNDCFICASCKTSLVGRGFITDADDIICPECAKQKLM